MESEEESQSSATDEEDLVAEDEDPFIDKQKLKNIKKQSQKQQVAKTRKKPKKIILNISQTKYDVVRWVGKHTFEWKISKEEPEEVDWDILWCDGGVQPERLAKMKNYQKINHFPGMYSIARKNHLARNLMRLQRVYPKDYKFFPQTWLLPAEYADFKAQFSKKKNKTFIVKPEASCQGRGIFLTRKIEDTPPNEHYVAQRYVHNPYLIDGLKFDLRIYVLVAGCDPLRMFIHEDGLCRLATEEYVPPAQGNLSDLCMHLTNYAINKNNENFVFNEDEDEDDIGHKRSLAACFRKLEEDGHDIEDLWAKISDIIIKTLCAVQPILSHTYRSCQPDDITNAMCFEILGFDILLDHKLRPYLLEVNHSPSFTTDTPLDKSIKRRVIGDSLKLMKITLQARKKLMAKKQKELQQRVLTGKAKKTNKEERAQECQEYQEKRTTYEDKNLGGYERIYPNNNEEKYADFIKTAKDQ